MRGPRPLVTLLEVTNASVRSLLRLATSGRWSESSERERATAFAGPRLPLTSRRSAGVARPEAVWPWIDSLDAIQALSGGAHATAVAQEMGYTHAALNNRVHAMERAGAAEAERAELCALREDKALKARRAHSAESNVKVW